MEILNVQHLEYYQIPEETCFYEQTVDFDDKED